MHKTIYIGTILVTAMLGWMAFISPAMSDYRDSRAKREQAQEEYVNVTESGYRVSESDIKAVERALGDDYSLPIRALEYEITQQDKSSVSVVGPDYNLESALTALSGATITVDPTYNVLLLPEDVAPVRPIRNIGFRYSLGSNNVRITVNKAP